MLQATDLRKSYGATAAVAGVSLTVNPGEIVGLLGPNGAGKSTTISMICGLVRPDGGTVTIAGEPIGEDASAVKRRIGLVPQELSLYEDLSAIGNLELFGALYGITGAVLAERMRAALELVGLADHARAKPATFSGGMKRRLNIACALVHDPDVLLLDEPTVGVDPQSRNAIFANIEALRERGKAIVYTTHYMEEAERLCDRIVIMDHGRVAASGTKESLRRMLPASGRHRAEIEGLIDDEVLAFLAARGLAVRDADSQGSLEDVFLHLTGKQLRDSP
jgi:ABC-2 type transport system ATP-binding protein